MTKSIFDLGTLRLPKAGELFAKYQYIGLWGDQDSWPPAK